MVFQGLGLVDWKNDLSFCGFVFQAGQFFAKIFGVLYISGVLFAYTELVSSVLDQIFAMQLMDNHMAPVGLVPR